MSEKRTNETDYQVRLDSTHKSKRNHLISFQSARGKLQISLELFLNNLSIQQLPQIRSRFLQNFHQKSSSPMTILYQESGQSPTTILSKQNKLDQRSQWTRKLIILLIASLGETLQQLHSLGIVHNDFKIDNIRINILKQRVTLIDFRSAFVASNFELMKQIAFPESLQLCYLSTLSRKVEIPIRKHSFASLEIGYISNRFLFLESDSEISDSNEKQEKLKICIGDRDVANYGWTVLLTIIYDRIDLQKSIDYLEKTLEKEGLESAEEYLQKKRQFKKELLKKSRQLMSLYPECYDRTKNQKNTEKELLTISNTFPLLLNVVLTCDENRPSAEIMENLQQTWNHYGSILNKYFITFLDPISKKSLIFSMDNQKQETEITEYLIALCACLLIPDTNRRMFPKLFVVRIQKIIGSFRRRKYQSKFQKIVSLIEEERRFLALAIQLAFKKREFTYEIPLGTSVQLQMANSNISDNDDNKLPTRIVKSQILENSDDSLRKSNDKNYSAISSLYFDKNERQFRETDHIDGQHFLNKQILKLQWRLQQQGKYLSQKYGLSESLSSEMRQIVCSVVDRKLSAGKSSAKPRIDH